MLICLRCGNIMENDQGEKCLLCNYPVIMLNFEENKEFITAAHWENDYDNYLIEREKMYQQILYNSPDFDKELFDKQIPIQEEKIKKEMEVVTKARQQHAAEEAHKPHCPICNSTNLSKISTMKKAAKIAAFGIFGMGDNGKTYKCNNCGVKF